MVDLEAGLMTLRNYFNTGQSKDLPQRQAALSNLSAVLQRHEQQLLAAVSADLGKPVKNTLQSELQPLYREIKLFQRHLSRWMRPEPVRHLAEGAWYRSVTVREPYGVVLILSNWSAPLRYSFLPLIDVLAAGNCAILKPPSHQPHVSQQIVRICREAFTPTLVQCLWGGDDLSERLVRLPVDHIVFTGRAQTAVGIMKQAAHRLTPLTLALGGKVPCIVTSAADLKQAAAEVINSKRFNSGQDCEAVDYCLVDAAVKEQFLDELVDYMRSLNDLDPLHNPLNQRLSQPDQYERLCRLLSSGRVVWGGRANDKERKIELTILDRVTFQSPVMQQEIFGPILPVLSYTNLPQTIETVNGYPHPLLIYAFTQAEEDRTLLEQFAVCGALWINGIPVGQVINEIPKSGIGASGLGAYQGIEGLRRFTYPRTLIRRQSLRFMERR